MEKRTLKQILGTAIVSTGLLFNSGCGHVLGVWVIDKMLIEPTTGFSVTDAVLKELQKDSRSIQASASYLTSPPSSSERTYPQPAPSRIVTAQYERVEPAGNYPLKVIPEEQIESKTSLLPRYTPQQETAAYQREEEKQRNYSLVKSLESRFRQSEMNFRSIEKEKTHLLEQESKSIMTRISDKKKLDDEHKKLLSETLVPILEAERKYEQDKRAYENAKSDYEGRYGK
ncbi:hypothetical protein A3K73_00820 [Candidatus Pacearchaeota archaeon RBG_13_36_9]|nr:MAG: hypothetical protein A3K73_00820 [Candidatus Pacearchaeota archaeon RBG_13_36_9]